MSNDSQHVSLLDLFFEPSRPEETQVCKGVFKQTKHIEDDWEEDIPTDEEQALEVMQVVSDEAQPVAVPVIRRSLFDLFANQYE